MKRLGAIAALVVAGSGLALLLVARAASPTPESADSGRDVARSPAYEPGFTVSLSDYPDWERVPLDKQAYPTLELRLATWYAATDPLATAMIEVHVMPLSRDDAGRSLAEQVERWNQPLEGFLANPRQRSVGPVEIAGVAGYKVDVRGDHLAGVHQITYYLARNGTLQYLLYVTRNYEAVDDVRLAEEIQEIVDSFAFHTIEEPRADPRARGDHRPWGSGGGQKPAAADEDIDPALLARKEYDMGLWRYRCVKPEGLLERELSDLEKQHGIKQKFQHDRDFSRLVIRVWAHRRDHARGTLVDLGERRIEEFTEYDGVADMREPRIDRRWELPLADAARRIDLLGRARMVLRRSWVLADCANGMRYQLEVFLSGPNGQAVWGDTVEEFLDAFEPYRAPVD